MKAIPSLRLAQQPMPQLSSQHRPDPSSALAPYPAGSPGPGTPVARPVAVAHSGAAAGALCPAGQPTQISCRGEQGEVIPRLGATRGEQALSPTPDAYTPHSCHPTLLHPTLVSALQAAGWKTHLHVLLLGADQAAGAFYVPG
jgi:hypothetical protein